MFNIKSKITEKLFSYYFLNPKADHYLNELARILSVDPGNLDRKLKELEKDGIFTSQTKGNLKYYFLNQSYPLLKQLKDFFHLNYGLEKDLTAALKKIKGLKTAYVFGSYAKGGFSAESDVDLLLVGSHSSLDAKRLIIKIEDKFKREFNTIDLTEADFNKRKKNKDDFLTNIFSDKTIKLL